MKPDTQHKKQPLTLAVATLVLTFCGTTAIAGDTRTFTDYARVTHVEPVYRYVTVNTPQRVCTPQYRDHHSTYSVQQHHNNRQRQRHHNRQHANNRHDSTGAVFIGGLIGGAIGREVSKSVNGRSSVGATVAGAVIGSTLASAGSRGNHRGNYGNNRRHGTSPQQHHHRSDHSTRSHQRRDYGHPQQRCTTTTHTSKEKRADGYRVTYMYKGNTFKTHMHHHPRQRIPVQVSLSPLR